MRHGTVVRLPVALKILGRRGWNEVGKVGGELELLCGALDALRTESELEAFAHEACLERVSSTGEHLRVWKGKAVGAGVEIVLIPALVPGGGWEISVLVTLGSRVEHVRRRPFKG